MGWQQLGRSPLETALAVFESKVQRVTLRGFDAAQNEAVCRAADAEVEGEPAFAELWLGAHQRHALVRDDVLHQKADRGELHGLELLAGKAALLPLGFFRAINRRVRKRGGWRAFGCIAELDVAKRIAQRAVGA